MSALDTIVVAPSIERGRECADYLGLPYKSVRSARNVFALEGMAVQTAYLVDPWDCDSRAEELLRRNAAKRPGAEVRILASPSPRFRAIG